MNYQKGFVIPLIIAIVALFAIAFGVYVYKINKAVAPANITATTTATSTIVGGDRDAHGCIGSAGYSWCGAKNKCLRVWEEKCEATSIATTTDEFANWKTYTNTQYGFEIRYPYSYEFTINKASIPNLYLEIHPSLASKEFGINLLITVGKLEQNISLDKYVDNFLSKNCSVLSREYRDVNNIRWVEIKWKEIYPVGPDYILGDDFTIKNGNIYQLDYNVQDHKDLEKILGTFKFTN
ncbi:MAG: hypothetical protein WCC74_00785 [Minisyncoccia bacterium]